jgi:transposase InsO family protein
MLTSVNTKSRIGVNDHKREYRCQIALTLFVRWVSAIIRRRPRLPWQNGYAERVIGSIRRECLDHAIVFGEAHLRRISKTYAGYYDRVRTHLSLDKAAPLFRRAQTVDTVATIPVLGGFRHRYMRV